MFLVTKVGDPLWLGGTGSQAKPVNVRNDLEQGSAGNDFEQNSEGCSHGFEWSSVDSADGIDASWFKPEDGVCGLG